MATVKVKALGLMCGTVIDLFIKCGYTNVHRAILNEEHICVMHNVPKGNGTIQYYDNVAHEFKYLEVTVDADDTEIVIKGT